jgi:2-iminoacetate synthase ThiH
MGKIITWPKSLKQIETTMEKIMHMAGNKSPEGMAKDAMRQLIREAGKEAVERDIFYNHVAEAAAV